MVRVISISDEVYAELSKIKNGKSFTEVIKSLIAESANKGSPESILEFLKANGPLIDEETAKNILEASEEGRKRTMAREFAPAE